MGIPTNSKWTSASARHKPAIWGCTPGGGGNTALTCISVKPSSSWCQAVIHMQRCDLPFSKLRPKISDLQILELLPPKGENLHGTDMYHHAKFYADQCHPHRDVCNRTEKTATDITFHTNVWWVKVTVSYLCFFLEHLVAMNGSRERFWRINRSR